MMNVSTWLAATAMLLLFVGCAPTTKEIAVGSETIIFDASTEHIKVFLKDAFGNKVSLSDNCGYARMSWKVEQVSPDLIKLYTGDTGWYKVFREGASWRCLVDGMFLAPSKQKALRFFAEHGKVRAILGDTEAPSLTDIWVHDEVLLQESSFEKLNVRWPAENRVEILGASGEVLATLQDNTNFAR